ncbi:hypothetical protein LSAT2_020419 [Lamellibrachia satsuma]|nr:hypothetical protein LSAT2_020419 [Lamellibrachia satsuma]
MLLCVLVVVSLLLFVLVVVSVLLCVLVVVSVLLCVLVVVSVLLCVLVVVSVLLFVLVVVSVLLCVLVVVSVLLFVLVVVSVLLFVLVVVNVLLCVLVVVSVLLFVLVVVSVLLFVLVVVSVLLCVLVVVSVLLFVLVVVSVLLFVLVVVSVLLCVLVVVSVLLFVLVVVACCCLPLWCDIDRHYAVTLAVLQKGVFEDLVLDTATGSTAKPGVRGYVSVNTEPHVNVRKSNNDQRKYRSNVDVNSPCGDLKPLCHTTGPRKRWELFKPEIVEKDKKIVHLYTGSRNLTSELEQLKRSKELKHLEYQITKKKATLKKATSHYKTENVFRRDKSCQIRMRK